MIFKGAPGSMYSAHTRHWMTESLCFSETCLSGLHFSEAKAPWLMLTKTAKINSCRSSVGVYLKKPLHRKPLRAHTLSKTTGDVKTSEMWDYNSSGCCVQQKSCIILKVTALIHHILPPGSSQRTPKHLNRIKGSPLRRSIAKSCNVNHLKTGKTKGNSELLLDNIKWHVVTGDENNLGLTGFESVVCGLHHHRDENALMKNG